MPASKSPQPLAVLAYASVVFLSPTHSSAMSYNLHGSYGHETAPVLQVLRRPMCRRTPTPVRTMPVAIGHLIRTSGHAHYCEHKCFWRYTRDSYKKKRTIRSPD